MLVFLKKRLNQSEVQLPILILTIFFYLFRGTIPFFKYPFIILYAGILFFLIINQWKQIIHWIPAFLKNYYLVIILYVILILSFAFSDKIFQIIFKDVVNSLIIITFFGILNFIIITQKDLIKFKETFTNLLIFFSFILAIQSLGSLLSIFNENVYGYLNTSDGLKLNIDHNFGIMPVIFGIIILCYSLSHKLSKPKEIFYEFLVVFFSLSVFFSGSRRGLIVLLVLIVIFTTFQLLRAKKHLKVIWIKPGILIFLSLIICFFYFVFTVTSYSFKNRSLEMLGSKNIGMAKENIATILYKYTSIIDEKHTYQDFYNRIWDVIPEDPESGWGTRTHKVLFPLIGENVEIVPSQSKGYLMDNTCDSKSWGGNAFSITQIAMKKVKDNDFLNASVYCFVSDEFNGDWVALTSEGSTFGKVAAYYDLTRKNTWQKLTLNTDCNDGQAPVFLFFCKNGVKDFSNLSGCVIFAYPLVKILNSRTNYVDSISSVNAPGKKVYKLSDPSSFTSSRLTAQISKGALGSAFFLFDKHFTLTRDPIRQWISDLIVEDTTYQKLKNEVAINNFWNKYGDERIIRWIFAVQIFSNEYTFRQKLFGGGFNFLNWYGYYFLNDKTAVDWPHNPFLSILLYSGIFGLLIYCFFMYKVFYYYIRYRKEYPLLFIFFLITFFFSFFSGGSPFDPPIMGFFSILPFFIHHVHSKDKVKLKPELEND